MTETEAFERASGAVGYALRREPALYRWGWVFWPNTEAYGPGPVAVTKDGRVVAHGSGTTPVTFQDEREPEEPKLGESSFWERLTRMFGI